MYYSLLNKHDSNELNFVYSIKGGFPLIAEITRSQFFQ